MYQSFNTNPSHERAASQDNERYSLLDGIMPRTSFVDRRQQTRSKETRIHSIQMKQLQELRDQLKTHCEALAKERDALREIQDEIEGILEPTDRGVEALEEAIASISERV